LAWAVRNTEAGEIDTRCTFRSHGDRIGEGQDSIRIMRMAQSPGLPMMTNFGFTDRDRAGNTWAGRGAQPVWLREKLKAGAKLEDFAIHKTGRMGGFVRSRVTDKSPADVSTAGSLSGPR
jgi:hypothetical protein